VLSPSDTAYPLLKANPTGRELQELFTPNLCELGFAGQNTRQPIPRLGLLLLLKSFQKLGYFVRFAKIPLIIVRHIAELDVGVYDDGDCLIRPSKNIRVTRGKVALNVAVRQQRHLVRSPTFGSCRSRKIP
jgi:hypothetical protein